MNKQRILLFPIGFIAGILCGLFGTGGGVVIVLFIALYLQLDQHIAQATAISITFVAATVSSVIYYFHGNLAWSIILPIAAGSIIGGYLGAKMMNRVPSSYLKRFFGLFMILSGMRMIF